MFSPIVLDHFKNARNVGVLTDATESVRVSNPVCGDTLELSLLLDGLSIAKARFRAKGCVPTIACASRLTEMIEGSTMADALSISRESLIASLGGLPEASGHAAQLALDALRAAIDGSRVPPCDPRSIASAEQRSRRGRMVTS